MKRWPLHISWILTVGACGVLLGLALSAWIRIPLHPLEYIVLGVGVLMVLRRRSSWMVMVLVLLLGLAIGVDRGSRYGAQLDQFVPFIGQAVTIQGRVREDPTLNDRGQQRLRLDRVVLEGRSYSGEVWVSLDRPASVLRGDTVHLDGTISRGFGTFAVSMFQARVESIERPSPGDVGRRGRDWFARGVQASLDPDKAGLALGFLVGQKHTLSSDLAEEFRVVGLVHAVVASGFHLTVLVAVVRRIFARYSKYLSAVLSGTVIVGFIAITGLSPSMTRAGVVSALILWAWYYGRVVHPVVLLPLVAAVTAYFRPSYIWGDIGWYLSFAAFVGVLIVAPLLHAYFWGETKPSPIRELIITTLAALALTMPITMYAFGSASILALPANLLVVPLVSTAMALTFIVGCIGLLLPAIAPFVAAPLWLILEYMQRIVGWLAALPYAQSEVQLDVWGVIGCYGMIGLLTWYVARRTQFSFRKNVEV